MIELNGKQYKCSCNIPMEIVDDKWKFLILWNLSIKPLRISELSERIPDTSQRTINRKLKSLEEVSLIKRVVFPEVPPKVEYSLTIHGERLVEIFETMRKWGDQYAENMGGKIE
ncbi:MULTISPECIES: helix-turn-helix domain-containing protein [Arcobacter]|uniref:Transcriptional regulator, HxlR family n=1 Tax=Arcobacter nitrofigilis (strain ATCC 33309 / DSM 7299 / CCUG 15893 / LMG 7604 / NCTC 12251 / CI) TaxID=572480 RepID=D5V264_ARCNC|nr:MULTISPECIES: helix-turn-helix domain-containing protein [Arcobacter]ADG92297.1 transcriptional regulator, HxlR family [Arcobacter nitrofigilis DSM 7299]RXJ81423.1 transcriptional regulator [Arcobacter sp. F2176]|tara:strand:+ start:10475 stop:10816 length:342 start_codon:yes stop_codon:yes gene_type:complete|eukprot:TRINITY_DN1031_c0_g1_i4.p2 TRINITY_DN1031_c0_g1~~TRINITY_DN1031_c0_g1_i4.p2  ORF type:complete len:114 (-),score=0.58 TRINITY_DN1031_c0_g1_i4:383-724(-)